MAGIIPCDVDAALKAVGGCCSKIRDKSEELHELDVQGIKNCHFPVFPRTIGHAFELKECIMEWKDAKEVRPYVVLGIQSRKKKLNGIFWTLSEWIIEKCGTTMRKVDKVKKTPQRNVLSTSSEDENDNFKENSPQKLKRKVKKHDEKGNHKKIRTISKLNDAPLRGPLAQSKAGKNNKGVVAAVSSQKDNKKGHKTSKMIDLTHTSSEDETDYEDVQIVIRRTSYTTRNSSSGTGSEKNTLLFPRPIETAVKAPDPLISTSHNDATRVSGRRKRSSTRQGSPFSFSTKLNTSEDVEDSDGSEHSEDLPEQPRPQKSLKPIDFGVTQFSPLRRGNKKDPASSTSAVEDSRTLRSSTRKSTTSSSSTVIDDSSEDLDASYGDSEVESSSDDDFECLETDEEEDDKPDPNFSLQQWKDFEMKKLLGLFKHVRKDEFDKLEAFGNEIMMATSKRRPFEPFNDYIVKEDASVLEEVVTRLWATRESTGTKNRKNCVYRVACKKENGEETGCIFTAPSRRHFSDHFNRHHMSHVRRFKCGVCHKSFQCKDTVRVHILSKHQVYSKVACDICGCLLQVKSLLSHKLKGHAQPPDGKLIVKGNDEVTERNFVKPDLKAPRKNAIHQVYIEIWEHDSKRDEISVQITSKASIVGVVKSVDDRNSRGRSDERHCKTRKLQDQGYKPRYDKVIPLNLFIKGLKLSHRVKCKIRNILNAYAVHRSDKYNKMFKPIIHIITKKINTIKHLLPRRHQKIFEEKYPNVVKV